MPASEKVFVEDNLRIQSTVISNLTKVTMLSDSDKLSDMLDIVYLCIIGTRPLSYELIGRFKP